MLGFGIIPDDQKWVSCQGQCDEVLCVLLSVFELSWDHLRCPLEVETGLDLSLYRLGYGSDTPLLGNPEAQWCKGREQTSLLLRSSQTTSTVKVSELIPS